MGSLKTIRTELAKATLASNHSQTLLNVLFRKHHCFFFRTHKLTIKNVQNVYQGCTACRGWAGQNFVSFHPREGGFQWFHFIGFVRFQVFQCNLRMNRFEVFDNLETRENDKKIIRHANVTRVTT